MSKLLKVASLLFLCNSARKKLMMKLIFLHADKHERLNSYYDFWLGWSMIPKVPKIARWRCLYSISKKNLQIKLIFCMLINIEVFYKLISTLWASNFPTRWYYHYGWTMIKHSQSLKATNMQYLYKI